MDRRSVKLESGATKVREEVQRGLQVDSGVDKRRAIHVTACWRTEKTSSAASPGSLAEMRVLQSQSATGDNEVERKLHPCALAMHDPSHAPSTAKSAQHCWRPPRHNVLKSYLIRTYLTTSHSAS